MNTIDIQEARAHLSRLVDGAARGEAFIIAKAGKPMVRVIALDSPESTQVRRLGFLNGEIAVPDDFDEMGQEQVEAMFGLGL